MVWSAEIILCFVTIWKYNIKEHLLDHHEQCEKYANAFCLSNKEWEMVLKFKLVLKCICSEYSFVGPPVLNWMGPMNSGLFVRLCVRASGMHFSWNWLIIFFRYFA